VNPKFLPHAVHEELDAPASRAAVHVEPLPVDEQLPEVAEEAPARSFVERLCADVVKHAIASRATQWRLVGWLTDGCALRDGRVGFLIPYRPHPHCRTTGLKCRHLRCRSSSKDRRSFRASHCISRLATLRRPRLTRRTPSATHFPRLLLTFLASLRSRKSLSGNDRNRLWDFATAVDRGTPTSSGPRRAKRIKGGRATVIGDESLELVRSFEPSEALL
jgi:hypothetical protein